jgi:hypothetical protein
MADAQARVWRYQDEPVEESRRIGGRARGDIGGASVGQHGRGTCYDIAYEARQHTRVELASVGDVGMLGHAEA